jgi:hypothetical protein
MQSKWQSLITSYEQYLGGDQRIRPWQDKYYVCGGIPYRLLADGELGIQRSTISMTAIAYIILPNRRAITTFFQMAEWFSAAAYGIGLNCEILGSYGLVWVTNTGAVDTTRTPRTSTFSIYKIKALPEWEIYLLHAQAQGCTKAHKPSAYSGLKQMELWIPRSILRISNMAG